MDRSLDPSPARPRASYFIRHWRGELSLARSFWVNSVLLSAIWLPLLGLEPLVRKYPPGVGSLGILLVAFAAILVFMIAMSIWQGVGTWRSARRHRAQGGRMLWIRLVYALILLDCAYALYSLAEADGQEALKSAWQLWRDPQQIPSHHITLLARDELGIAGGLPPGSAEAVRQQLDAHPEVTRIQLDSTGGLLIEAQAIAKLVKEKGLITYTNGNCLSACTLVYQAGRERWLGPEGRLGYHASGLYGTGASSTTVAEMYRQALLDDGLSGAFIDQVLNTHQDSMWFPDRDTLRRERIVTRLADPADFADRWLARLREPGQLEAYLRRSALMRTMEQKAPEQFAAEKRQFAEALQQAERFDAVNTTIIQRQNELLRRAMLQAPAPVALDFLRDELDFLGALAQIDSEACWAFISGKPVRGPIPEQVEASRRAAGVRVFESAMPLRADDPPVPVPVTVDADLDAVFRRVEQRLPQAYEHFRSHDRGTLCTVHQALYREALALPDPQRAAAALMELNGYRR
ncbi:MAG: hypothetical protein P0Y58_21135 [Candidatus Pseudomonas phytovorans]|uniref:Uncharacterized protein n=1 Tax=Candidatus Pseudomonas phytovorans TaxID=3121377 RepID=A0AAJ5WFF0_9PSED|nr:hypothetical protein [Pseudomonas sp.]WEK29386.1 MAG: hypothetical protein P0Y58_21135 [Pseudomonas sp.]